MGCYMMCMGGDGRCPAPSESSSHVHPGKSSGRSVFPCGPSCHRPCHVGDPAACSFCWLRAAYSRCRCGRFPCRPAAGCQERPGFLPPGFRPDGRLLQAPVLISDERERRQALAPRRPAPKTGSALAEASSSGQRGRAPEARPSAGSRPEARCSAPASAIMAALSVQ